MERTITPGQQRPAHVWGQRMCTMAATCLLSSHLNKTGTCIVIDIRKLAALDLAFLGPRIILTEFSLGVFGSFALGVLTLLRSHSMGGLALGSYLLLIGVNYVPLLLHAISIVRRNSVHFEIADEVTEKRMFRKYRRQSLLLLVPLVVPIVALAQRFHSGMPPDRVKHR